MASRELLVTRFRESYPKEQVLSLFFFYLGKSACRVATSPLTHGRRVEELDPARGDGSVEIVSRYAT